MPAKIAKKKKTTAPSRASRTSRAKVAPKRAQAATPRPLHPELVRLAYSVREVAALIGRDERTVRRYVERGVIPAARGMGQVLIPAEGLHEWLSGKSA